MSITHRQFLQYSLTGLVEEYCRTFGVTYDPTDVYYFSMPEIMIPPGAVMETIHDEYFTQEDRAMIKSGEVMVAPTMRLEPHLVTFVPDELVEMPQMMGKLGYRCTCLPAPWVVPGEPPPTYQSLWDITMLFYVEVDRLSEQVAANDEVMH